MTVSDMKEEHACEKNTASVINMHTYHSYLPDSAAVVAVVVVAIAVAAVAAVTVAVAAPVAAAVPVAVAVAVADAVADAAACIISSNMD